MSTDRLPVFETSTSMKRDSLAAELERDPHLSSAKRHQRTQAFKSNMAHASFERQLIAAQSTKMELESKLREKEMLIEKLERDRRWLAEREQEEREEKERERTESQEQMERKDNELRTLRSTLIALREELADLNDTHSNMSRTTAQTIASQKSQIATLTRQTSLLDEEVSQFKLLAEERSQTIDEFQVQLQGLSAPAPEDKAATEQEHSDMVVVREELHRQAAYLRSLEATNARLTSELVVLRDRHASIEVLREEKRSLELKLQPLTKLRETVIRLEAQLEVAKREQETWAQNDMSTSTPSKPSVSVTHTLSALRFQHAQLLEDHGATTALLRAKEAELSHAEIRAAEAQETVERLENDINLLGDKASRCEHRASLAEREVGFMKALVSSYSLEEANKEGDVSMDSARAEQVHQLEALLQSYKTANSQLSQQLNETAAREPMTVSQEREHELEAARAVSLEAQQALEAAQAESCAQLEKIEQLEQELHELGGEIAGGRHIPPGVRVLSLVDTPELLLRDRPEARTTEIDRVKAENAALIRRVEALQRDGGHVEDADAGNANGIPKESWDAVCKDRDELQALVKQKEKRLLRLQSVFQSKAGEFRESIASLLGVKLAFFQNGQVRVTSLYDASATFVFKPASSESGGNNANMQLIAQGDGGPEDLPNLMAYWVGTEQCIPGFLASVTLELYDKWKREGGHTAQQ